MAALITLTTDFGTRDPYVASMKGVIFAIAPRAVVVDLGHDISPGDITEGALFLAASVPLFPSGAIHVGVIDPGVGTSRQAIAARVGEGIFVGPDNGLLTLLDKRMAVVDVRRLENPRVMRPTVSATFHGRDIFAPAAAHLASGFPFDDLGSRVDELVTLAWPEPTAVAHEAYGGHIVHVDRFGNAVTNVPGDWVADLSGAWVSVGAHTLEGIRGTYSDVAVGQPLALVGSSGYVEISVNGGDAAAQFGLCRGDAITIGRKGG